MINKIFFPVKEYYPISILTNIPDNPHSLYHIIPKQINWIPPFWSCLM
jgi:hypothetical protein